MIGGFIKNSNYKWYKFLLKKERTLFFVILFICFGLRIFNFSSASLWVDEAYTLMLSHQKTHDIVKISVNDINPPFYGIVIRKWAKTFGFTHTSIRFFSVMCSFLTGLVLYRIGRKFFNYLTALTAALFFSISNLQIYYAEEARSYALACFLCAVSIYYFLSYLKNQSIWSLVFLCIINILVLHTHYVAGLLFVAEAVVAILFLYYKPSSLLKYIISQGIALSAFMPWFLSSWFSLDSVQIGWLPKVSYDGFVFFFKQVLNHGGVLILLSGWLIISLILFFVCKNKRKLKQFFILFILSSLPLILICICTQYYIRLFLDRYILFTTIPMFLFFGYMFSSVRLHLLLKIMVIAVYLYFAVSMLRVDAFRNEEWDRACIAGDALNNENTSVLLYPPYIVNCYDYYNMRWTYDNDYKGLIAARDKYNVFAVGDTNDVKSVTYRLKDRVMLYTSHYWGGEDKKPIESFLSRSYNQVYFRQFWNVRLYIYEKKK